jgi:hypothetical protein
MNHPAASECARDADAISQPAGQKAILYGIAPGLDELAAYQREWFRHDLNAGESRWLRSELNRILLSRLLPLQPHADSPRSVQVACTSVCR